MRKRHPAALASTTVLWLLLSLACGRNDLAPGQLGPSPAGSTAPDGGTPPDAANSVSTETILYSHDGGLYAIRADGTGLVQLYQSDVGDVAFVLWGVTGGRLVFSRYGFTGDAAAVALLSVRPDASDLVALAPALTRPGPGPIGPTSLRSVSQGRVLFTVDSAAPSSSTAPPSSGDRSVPRPQRLDLYSVNADGTDLVWVADVANATPPAVVGGHVLFSRSADTANGAGQRDLYRADVDGRGMVRLTDGPTSEDFVAAVGERLVIAVDGDLLAIDADGGGRAALATAPEPESFVAVIGDGRVVFSRSAGKVGEPEQKDLHVVGLDGSGPVALAAGPEDETFAAAVGDRVVFGRRRAIGGPALYSVSANGADTRPLATTDLDQSFVGTVGDRVIFARQPQPTTVIPGDLFSVRVAGGGEATLAAAPERELVAAVAGGRVIFRRLVPGGPALPAQSDLFSVHADGTDLVLLADNPEEDIVSATIGDRLILERGGWTSENDLYVIGADGRGRVPLAPAARFVAVVPNGD